MDKYESNKIVPQKEFVDNVLPFKIKEDSENIYILDYKIPKLNKMTVGVLQSDENKKIQYCISTIEQ